MNIVRNVRVWFVSQSVLWSGVAELLYKAVTNHHKIYRFDISCWRRKTARSRTFRFRGRCWALLAPIRCPKVRDWCHDSCQALAVHIRMLSQLLLSTRVYVGRVVSGLRFLRVSAFGMGISWGFLSLLIPFVILGFVQLANDKIAYVNQMDSQLKALIFSTFSSICSV